MNSKLENNILTVTLCERIDSNNAEEIEKEINACKEGKTFDQLIIDADGLQYISSAGLRVVLRQKKSFRNMKVINCSSGIYETFEMTGFTEMMTVEKALRKMSVEGCEIIGEGSNGIVYRYNDDTVIKVYKNPDCLQEINHERELAKKAFVSGINTAISYDVVKVDEKYGSVFEMLTAKSVTKLILGNPEKMEEYIKVTTDLLKQIHQTEMADLPDNKQITLQREQYLEKYLEKEDYDRLIALTQAIPYSNHMIHGDFHTSNVHYENGETLLIDMDTLSIGNPVFEFASIYLAYVGFSELDPNSVRSFLKVEPEMAKKFWDITLRQYFETDDSQILKDAENKARILGYMRLMRRTIKRISPDDPMVEHCRRNLHQLLWEVESLAY